MIHFLFVLSSLLLPLRPLLALLIKKNSSFIDASFAQIKNFNHGDSGLFIVVMDLLPNRLANLNWNVTLHIKRGYDIFTNDQENQLKWEQDKSLSRIIGSTAKRHFFEVLDLQITYSRLIVSLSRSWHLGSVYFHGGWNMHVKDAKWRIRSLSFLNSFKFLSFFFDAPIYLIVINLRGLIYGK